MYIRANDTLQSSVVADICAENLNNRAKYLQKVLKAFWSRFNTNYLSELREHHIYRNHQVKNNEINVLKVGDIVVIKDDNISPRSAWRLGRIDRLVKGSDQKVWGAVILTISPTGKRTKLTKPVQRIIPLEIPTAPVTNDDVVIPEKVDVKTEKSKCNSPRRSKRLAEKIVTSKS